jgi:ubiquinone/menaquinone biosynthesis C-methylase UbiE
MNTGAQSFDDLAEAYDQAAALERQHGFFLAHLPRHRGSALDAGCGTGLLSLELARHFRSVVAWDVSAPMLAVARRKRRAPNLEYHCGDVNDLPPAARFDAVVSHTMLHHVPDLPATLAKLKAALAPAGRLIVVDCVTRFPAFIPRWDVCYRAFAVLQWPSDLLRRGPDAAGKLWRFRTSPAWMAHIRSDRYFTPKQFREIYAASLPGAQFTWVKPFLGVVWTAPTPSPPT